MFLTSSSRMMLSCLQEQIKKIVHTIKTIINDFCEVSGMKINLDKSKLWLSPHIPQDRKDSTTNYFQIPNTSNLGNYLSYQLITRYSSANFNNIVLKLQQKIQKWKA